MQQKAERQYIYIQYMNTFLGDSTGSTSIIKHHMLREGYTVYVDTSVSLYENKEDCWAGVGTTTTLYLRIMRGCGLEWDETAATNFF